MPPDQKPQIQAIIDEYKLRIVRKIADGGMGSVYEAIQDGAAGFQKTVALKTILPDLADSGTLTDFFVQEAKLVANLVHENIVQIYQLGRTLDGYYMVMEYVNGLSLHEFMRVHKIMRMEIPLPLSVLIASRIARALHYAHTRTDPYGKPMHIVHRDVCPSNIMLTTEGLPKLTDFGIATMAGSSVANRRKALVGKAPYMPPEQANHEPTDHRSDLYALGALFFEMLSHQKIRKADDLNKLIEMAKEGVVNWDALPRNLDTALGVILERCLADDPEERYAETAELARDLEYFIYKDGYGPTTVTVERYLREKFDYLYKPKKRITLRLPKAADVTPGSVAKTIFKNEEDD